MYPAEHSNQSVFPGFERRFTLLKENNLNHIALLERVEFNEKTRQIKIQTDKLLNDHPKFPQLSALLAILTELDFLGVSHLLIDINGSSEQISLPVINSIRHSLSQLKNLACLFVVLTHQIDQIWKADALYLFMSYEAIFPWQQFFFKAELSSQQVLEMNQSYQEKLQIDIEIIDSILPDQHFQPHIDLSIALIKVFELAKEDRTSSELIDFRNKNHISLPNHEKRINLSFSMIDNQLHQQFDRIFGILQFFELDCERIQDVSILTDDWTIPDRKEESRMLVELRKLNLIKKIIIQFIIQNDLFFFSEIVKLVKGVKVKIKSSSQELTTQINGLLKEFDDENHRADEYFNMILFLVKEVAKEQIPLLLKIAAYFPNLKIFHLEKVNLQNLSMVSFLKQSVELGSKIEKVNLDNIIEFAKSKLRITIHQEQLFSYKDLTEFLPSIINQFDISFDFILEKREIEQNLAIEVCRNIIGLRNVSQFNINFNNRFPQLKTLTHERNSMYNSIVAFHIHISSMMAFNPKSILFDLYEFN